MADHNPCTIVAVMPPDFDFPHNVDFWYPARPEDMNRNATIRVYSAIGRLRAGHTLAQARSEMESISGALAAEFPEQNRGLGVRIDSIEHAIFGKAQPALWVLMAAVGLLLLAACVNAGNLLLSRAMDRQGEMRLRAALGAGRGRVVRQVLAEGLPIGLLGGAAGLLLARYGVAALVALAPTDIPRIAQAQVSGQVLLYTWLLSLVTVLVFMLPAALHASRVAPLGRTACPPPHARLLRHRAGGGLGDADHRRHHAGARLRRTQPHRPRFPSRSRAHVPHHALQTRVRRTGSAQAVLRADCWSACAHSPGAQSAAAILLRPLSGTVGWDTIFHRRRPDRRRTGRQSLRPTMRPSVRTTSARCAFPCSPAAISPPRPHRRRTRRHRQRRSRPPLLARPECRRQAPQTRAPRWP